MVQGLSQMYRVHQGCSCMVFSVKLVQPFTCDDERCYQAVIEIYAGQVSAVGKQECSEKDICSLVVLDWDHLLGSKELIFGRRCGRKRVSASLAGGLEPINFSLAKVES